MKPSLCLYLQMHQPCRLRLLDFFSIGAHGEYEDTLLNARIARQVTGKCYLPALKLFKELGRRHAGRFRLALSLSGVLLEQLERAHAEVVELIADMVAGGTVELLAETHDHSLAGLFSSAEFQRQIEAHGALVERLFGVRPGVFRNTELLYSDALAVELQGLGFKGCLAEGVSWLMGSGSANALRQSAGASPIPVLLRNRRLSDDLAFRFGDSSWHEYPLRPEKFVRWVGAEPDEVVNLFMDLEALGEHLDRATGIFHFWETWINEAVTAGLRFVTPTDLVARARTSDEVFRCPGLSSWADRECDASAWLGNSMQQEAAAAVYSLEEAVLGTDDRMLQKKWRHLQTSDHFYYMSTKSGTDGAVHGHFNPRGSPYDYYLSYMNALADLRILLSSGLAPRKTRRARQAEIRT